MTLIPLLGNDGCIVACGALAFCRRQVRRIPNWRRSTAGFARGRCTRFCLGTNHHFSHTISPWQGKPCGRSTPEKYFLDIRPCLRM